MIFALASFLVLCFSWTFLTGNYIPAHDTLHNFDLFYFFYNQFYTTGHIAQWMPNYTYGLPAGYWQIFAVSPTAYFCMLMGFIFKIPNALFLFNLSFFLENIIFVYGMYLLAKELFLLNSTRLFVCLSATSIHAIIGQSCFGIQIFYIFPLAAFCLLRFMSTKNPTFFWLCGLTVIFGAIGNTLYFPFIWIVALSVLFIGFTLKSTNPLKPLLSLKANNIALGALFIFMAACFYLTISELPHFAQMPFRADGKASNSLGMFLTYGDYLDLKKLLTWSIFGNNWSFYIGMIPCLFFIYALIKERSRKFFVFLSATVVIACLTFAGIVAVFLYFFPGMSLYRHLGMSYDLLKPLLLICAGFGWEYFFKHHDSKKFFLLLCLPFILIILTDALGISREWLAEISTNKALLKSTLFTFDVSSPLMRLCINAAGLLLVTTLVFKKTKRIEPLAKSILIAVVLLDIASFEYAIYQNSQSYLLPKSSPYTYTLNAAPLKYQEQRLMAPLESRPKDAWKLKHGDEAGYIFYASAYSFIGYEPCESSARQDFVPYRTIDILPIKKLFNPKNGYAIFGCSAPKMRLVSNVIYAPKLGDMLATLTNTDITNAVILSDLSFSSAPQSLTNPKPPLDQHITINHFDSNKVELDVNVPSTHDAMLVYADSYHHGWKAFVDDREVKVNAAYGAFKSIHVPAGNHHVRFEFSNGLRTWCSYFIAFFGLMACVVLIFFMIQASFHKHNQHNK